MSDLLWPHGLYSPWNSSGHNSGVGSLSFLQGIFPTQGSNPCLPHCRQVLYQLRHQGSPRILEWVTCPSSRGSSWPGNQTGVSCIAGRFFTNWAMREAPIFDVFFFYSEYSQIFNYSQTLHLVSEWYSQMPARHFRPSLNSSHSVSISRIGFFLQYQTLLWFKTQIW